MTVVREIFLSIPVVLDGFYVIKTVVQKKVSI